MPTSRPTLIEDFPDRPRLLRAVDALAAWSLPLWIGLLGWIAAGVLLGGVP